MEEDRLAAHPEIGKVLDSLETAAGRERLLKVSERIRIDAVDPVDVTVIGPCVR